MNKLKNDAQQFQPFFFSVVCICIPCILMLFVEANYLGNKRHLYCLLHEVKYSLSYFENIFF